MSCACSTSSPTQNFIMKQVTVAQYLVHFSFNIHFKIPSCTFEVPPDGLFPVGFLIAVWFEYLVFPHVTGVPDLTNELTNKRSLIICS